MKPLALLALALLLAGCSTDREDQAFFEHGWVKPDEGANRRMYGRPTAPTSEQSIDPALR